MLISESWPGSRMRSVTGSESRGWLRDPASSMALTDGENLVVGGEAATAGGAGATAGAFEVEVVVAGTVVVVSGTVAGTDVAGGRLVPVVVGGDCGLGTEGGTDSAGPSNVVVVGSGISTGAMSGFGSSVVGVVVPGGGASSVGVVLGTVVSGTVVGEGVGSSELPERPKPSSWPSDTVVVVESITAVAVAAVLSALATVTGEKAK